MSLAILLALPSESRSSKRASSVCSLANPYWTRWPSRRTACLRATTFIMSQQWRPIPSCLHDNSRGLPRAGRRAAETLRSNHQVQRRPGSQAPKARAWSSIANDHDFYDQMHLVHDCLAFTGESLHGSWHTSRACPNSIHSSRLRTVLGLGKNLPGVAFLLSFLAAIHYLHGRDHTSP